MVCNALARVAEAYKALRANRGIRTEQAVPAIVFRPSSVDFDKRTYSLKDEVLSLFTLEGRVKVAFVCGRHQRNLLASGTPKEATLMTRKGAWYFHLVLDLPEVAERGGDVRLGVDVGENNLAATSSGQVLGGGRLKDARDRHLAARRRLQTNGSRAARRKLQAISGRERRHMRHVNHETSKAIVQEALCVGAAEIRMEDLTHIRKRIRAGKRVRARLHRWAFRQLQDFVAYKAEAAGLRVVYVDPAYTSQTCSRCGALGKRERHCFSCSCGARLLLRSRRRRHADVNAAANIAGLAAPIGPARAAVNLPEFAHRGLRGVAKSASR
jgi:IS605 OrfB family transposase